MTMLLPPSITMVNKMGVFRFSFRVRTSWLLLNG
jgi:hypothetical protein